MLINAFSGDSEKKLASKLVAVGPGQNNDTVMFFPSFSVRRLLK